MKTLTLKIKYKSISDDIINDFYIPVLRKSKYYNRAVGYFTSNILVDYIKGIVPFIKNGGKMNLIISPYVTEEDFQSLSNDYYEDKTINQICSTIDEWTKLTNLTGVASKLMLLLVKAEIMEIKVAEPLNTLGLFHEKIGLFEDENNNRIAIIGSNNETRNSIKSNIESFNVFCSWKDGQLEYVDEHYHDFMSYWDGKVDNIKVIPINEALKMNILRKINIEESIEDLCSIIINEESKTDSFVRFKPYPHQVNSVNSWWNTKRGIFKFATGAGKTKTAIYLIEKLKQEESKLLSIVVVPDKTLVNQWYDEVIDYGSNVLKCYSDEIWEDKFIDLAYNFSVIHNVHQYIITTNDTFFGAKFQKILPKFKNDYLLIVDECHSWGTNRILSNLPNPKMRLGLSATPELFYSEEKTRKIIDFFGGITFEYSLEDAIKDNFLVGYKYYPIFVSLTDIEKEKYDDLTRKIVKILGFDAENYSDSFNNPIAEMLLFKRARIIYGAINKLVILDQIIDEIENKGNLLIYCGPTSYTETLNAEVLEESETQLESVNKLLARKSIQFAKYTASEKEYERVSAISLFRKRTYSTLVAIKCLDEGVNIPEVERAVILSSSTNPREFIQRRGRLLRKSYGKEFAEIYDFIVYDEQYPSLIKKELERFNEFSKISINLDDLKAQFDNIFNKIEEIKNNDR